MVGWTAAGTLVLVGDKPGDEAATFLPVLKDQAALTAEAQNAYTAEKQKQLAAALESSSAAIALMAQSGGRGGGGGGGGGGQRGGGRGGSPSAWTPQGGSQYGGPQYGSQYGGAQYGAPQYGGSQYGGAGFQGGGFQSGGRGGRGGVSGGYQQQQQQHFQQHDAPNQHGKRWRGEGGGDPACFAEPDYVYTVGGKCQLHARGNCTSGGCNQQNEDGTVKAGANMLSAFTSLGLKAPSAGQSLASANPGKDVRSICE